MRFLFITLISYLLLIVSPHSYAKDPYIIGLDADLSAVAKDGGIAIQRGAQIAIEEINAQGGVLGRSLKLVSKDHRGNPARGKHNIKAFAATPNLIAILGGVHTPVVLQELDLINQYKIPFLIPWAAGTPIIDNGFEPNYVFRLSIRDEQAGSVLVKEAKAEGHQKVALLLEQTGWGRSNQDSIQKASLEQGINVTHVSWFNWRQKSMKNELTRIKESGATAIMLVANAPEGATIIREILKSPEFKALTVYSHWGIASGQFTDNFKPEELLTMNLSVLQTYSFITPTNPSLNKKVLRSYANKFDKDVTAESLISAPGVAHSYDLIHLLATAVELGNSVESANIQKSLENIKSFKGLVKEYKPPFSPANHDALMSHDYFMAKYNESGFLVPKTHAEK